MAPIPLVVIVGPTAVGKSFVALEVAAATGGEVISGDSMQVYRGMDIGTAKLMSAQRQDIPHHLIDILEPDESFSVADFQNLATQVIEDIHQRGHLPLIAGGTGLYISAVTKGYTLQQIEARPGLREELTKLGEARGGEYLHSLLSEVDPLTASRLHYNDLRRIIRALEVYRTTGQPISALQQQDPSQSRYQTLCYGLRMDRQKLYARIEARVDQMITAGLVEEVRDLLQRGFRPELQSMQGLGYREITEYLREKCSLATAVELLKRNTRRYAKRQLTWFRADQRIKWLDVEINKNLTEISWEITQDIRRTFKANVEVKI